MKLYSQHSRQNTRKNLSQNSIILKMNTRTPACIAQTQIIDLFSLSENINKVDQRDITLIRHEPLFSDLITEKENIYICANGYSVTARDNLLLRYIFIGSKLTQINDDVSGLHLTSYALFYNAGNHTDFTSWAEAEGYKLIYMNIDNVIQSLDAMIEEEGLTEEFDTLAEDFNTGKSKKVNALYGIYSCLLGKKLSADNSADWGRKCNKALLGTVGGDIVGGAIESAYPTLQFANDYHNRISIARDLRRISYWFLKKASTSSTGSNWQKDLCGSILLRLSWTDLTGFKLIYTYLLSTNRFMWLWGWLACNAYSVLKAVQKFLSYKEEAPYLKLLTNNNENPEFNTYEMRRMAEVARIIGIIDGQSTLIRVHVGFRFDSYETVKEALQEILTAGDQGLYKWALFAREHILPVAQNSQFYKVIRNTNVVNPSFESKSTDSSASVDGNAQVVHGM